MSSWCKRRKLACIVQPDFCLKCIFSRILCSGGGAEEEAGGGEYDEKC